MRNLNCRIILTENCNESCEHCFNANMRYGKSMDVDKFMEFVTLNGKELHDVHLKIMGGEPTIHPRFEELVGKTVGFFELVSIFTNGTTMPKITKNPVFKNPNVYYTINGFTFDASKFHLYKDEVNYVSLHFVLTMNDSEKMVDKAINCLDAFGDKVRLIYSVDTQVNIFDTDIREAYGKVWTNAVTRLIPAVRGRAFFNPDHTVPPCFFTTQMIDQLDKVGLHDVIIGLTGCHCNALGLITTDFDLLHCNQTTIKLGSLLKDDGSFKKMDEIKEMIARGPRTKIEKIKQISKECSECPSLVVCRAACYYNTLWRNK
jgi:radical SAM protein with 4Fe4S-binding SPASM domain